MSICSKSAKSYRRLRFERLESRQVLSANLGLGQLPAVPPSVQHFDFAITGTNVFYSPAGLPTEMQGACYVTDPTGSLSATIGTYDETLQPIFANVGPGGAPAFVGANGVCTFDFNVSLGNGGVVTVGTIVCHDIAMIEGAQPDGTLLVGSHQSPIVSATGICAGLQGTFDSESTVVMGATFSMSTTVDFSVHGRWGQNMGEEIKGLAAVNTFVAHVDSTSHAQQPTLQEQHNLNSGSSQHESPSDRLAAVDDVFNDIGNDVWSAHRRH